jgi:hypothetical protein
MTSITSITVSNGQTHATKMEAEQDKKPLATITIVSQDKSLINAIESAVKRCINKLNPKK